MADRPYVNFREVKQKVSIPDALEKLGLLDQFTRKGDTFTGVCPLPEHQHGPQPNPDQFKINQKDGTWLWHCFGDCQRGGDVIELVKAVKAYDDAHVRFWFAEHFGDRLSLKKRKKEQGTQQAASDAPAAVEDELALKPLRFYLNLDVEAALPYLASRGIDEDTARLYGLGLCGKGIMSGYLAIPIYRWPKEAADENPVAYLGRWPGEDFDSDDGRPRYKAPGEFETSRVVFGVAQALADGNPRRPLLVVEGPLKAIWLSQRGFSAVSSFTAAISEAQAATLLATERPLVLAFDGDDAGYNGMRTAAGRLITGQFVRAVKLPQGTEPDQLSPAELGHYYGFAKA